MILEHAGGVKLGHEPVPQVVDKDAQLGQQALPATEITRFDGLEETAIGRAIPEVHQYGETRQTDKEEGPVTM